MPIRIVGLGHMKGFGSTRFDRSLLDRIRYGGEDQNFEG